MTDDIEFRSLYYVDGRMYAYLLADRTSGDLGLETDYDCLSTELTEVSYWSPVAAH